jgi:pilus assembly protein Flp/PilA
VLRDGKHDLPDFTGGVFGRCRGVPVDWKRHIYSSIRSYGGFGLLPQVLDKGKPVARPGRKAKGRSAVAWLPKGQRTGLGDELSRGRVLLGKAATTRGKTFVRGVFPGRYAGQRRIDFRRRASGRPVNYPFQDVVAFEPVSRPKLTPSYLEELMKNLALKVQRFLVSEDGPTAVEYAVMLALIVIVCLTAIQAVGTNANSVFEGIRDELNEVVD